MKIENLRNKYKYHPIIKPLIECCEKKSLSFEFIKESGLEDTGLKGVKQVNSYYMKIGNDLVETDSHLWHWNDLLRLLVEAYRYLGIEYPENLVKAARVFNRPI